MKRRRPIHPEKPAPELGRFCGITPASSGRLVTYLGTLLGGDVGVYCSSAPVKISLVASVTAESPERM